MHLTMRTLFPLPWHYPGQRSCSWSLCLCLCLCLLPLCYLVILALLVAAAARRLGSVNRVWLYGALSPKSQTKLQTNLPLPAQTDPGLRPTTTTTARRENWQMASGISIYIHIYIDATDSPKLLQLICLRQISLSHTHTHIQRHTQTVAH